MQKFIKQVRKLSTKQLQSLSTIIKANKLSTIVFAIFFIVLFLRAYTVTNFSDEFILTYKFVNTDSYDWWVSGLEFLSGGEGLSYRNPGLPALIKLLDLFGVSYLYAFVSNLNYFLLTLFCFMIAKKVSKSNIPSYLIFAFFFWNFAFLNLANFILADFYAITFISLAVLLTINNKWDWAFFILGISALFQNFSFFLLPILLMGYYHDKINNLGINPRNYINFLKENFWEGTKLVFLFLHLNLAWFIYKAVLFGNPLYSRVKQFSLLDFRPQFLDIFYLMSLADFGILLILVSILAIYSFRRYLRGRVSTFVILGFFTTLIFWGVIYQWTDPRFTYYLIPFVVYLFAEHFEFLVKNKSTKIILILSFIIFVIYPASIDTQRFNNIRDIPITNLYYIELEERIIEYDDFSRIVTAYPINFQPVRNEVVDVDLLEILHPEISDYLNPEYRYYLEQAYTDEIEFVERIENCYEQNKITRSCMRGNKSYRAYSTLYRLKGVNFYDLPEGEETNDHNDNN